MLSGFGAFVADARPGDPLYGLHVMFFDEPRVNDDQITLSAKADLAKVQQMIDQGQWAQAQNQLAEVSSTVEAMNDGNSRQNLMDEVNLLNTRVESRNPNATLPPQPATEVQKPPAVSTTPASPSAPPPGASSPAPSSSSACALGPAPASRPDPDPSVAPSAGP